MRDQLHDIKSIILNLYERALVSLEESLSLKRYELNV